MRTLFVVRVVVVVVIGLLAFHSKLNIYAKEQQNNLFSKFKKIINVQLHNI